MEDRLAFNAITYDFPGYHLKKQEQSVLLRKAGYHLGPAMGLEHRAYLPDMQHSTRLHRFLSPGATMT